MNRVLIIGAPPPPSGGVATHCRELVRALEGAGVRAELIEEGHAIPVARVQAMHEGKRRARAKRT